LLFLSTALFVIELGKQVPTVAAGDGNVFLGYKQSFKNTMISALANVTYGGSSTVLANDLNKLKGAIYSHTYQTVLTIDYVPWNSDGYQDGFWNYSGQNGHGVSSVYVTFVFASASSSASSNFECAINVTSEVNFAGNYQQIDQTTKRVELTVHLLNDGKAALADNFKISFLNSTDSVTVDSSNISTNDDGTYLISFNAETGQTNDPLTVYLMCQDIRGITVGAQTTCNIK
jgi:hypothetical protein